MGAPNKRTSKYMKQKLSELLGSSEIREEINKYIVLDLIFILSEIDRTKYISKDIQSV
jgi:hypothetical protein